MISESKMVLRVLESNFKRLRSPYKLSFCITYRCNLKCNMCSIWKKPLIQELTTEEIELFFRGANKFSWVGLTGGEIFLRPDLLDIVRITLKNCKDLNVLHFPTNGYMKEVILSGVEQMLKMNPRRLIVTVSVDGTEHIHDKIRGIPDSWKNATETFVALQRMGVPSIINMTVSHGNLGRIDETIRSIKDVFPEFDPDKMLNFNFFQASSHYYANSHLRLPKEDLLIQDSKKALAMLGRGSTLKNYLQKNYLKNYESYVKTGKSPLPCQALSASCFIDAYGDLFPCSVYDKKIANIREPGFNFDEVWNRKDVETLHHECKAGKCPGCWSPCEAYQAINGNLVKIIQNS